MFTPEEFRKSWFFPCSLLKILLKIKASPLKNSIFLLLYPQRNPQFLELTPEEFHWSTTGGMRVLNAIAHCHFISYLLIRDYNERDFILTSLLHRSYIIFDLWVIKVTFFNFFFKGEVTNFFLSWICRLLYFKATKRNGRSFVLNRWIQKNIKLHLWNICYRSNLISG